MNSSGKRLVASSSNLRPALTTLTLQVSHEVRWWGNGVLTVLTRFPGRMGRDLLNAFFRSMRDVDAEPLGTQGMG